MVRKDVQSFEGRSLGKVFEERFRALVRATAQIVWITNEAGLVSEDSFAWRDFTGQTWEQFSGFGWLDAIHPDDRELTAGAWRQAVRSQTRYDVVYRLRHKSGEWRWTTARGFPVFDDDDRINCWVGLNTDVTDQRNSKSALEESELQFRTLAENIPDLVWLADPQAQIYYWNPTWYHYTGQTVGLSLGVEARQFVHREYRAEALAGWLAAVRTESSFEMEFPLRNRFGLFEWFLARARPVRDGSGTVIRWCGVLTNINAQKQIASELRREKVSREQFVGALVHDLRNVLGAGRCALNNLADPDLEDGERDVYQSIAFRSFSRLNRMIEDLLDANNVNGGQPFRLSDTRRFVLRDQLNDVASSFRELMKVEIVLQVPREIEVVWSAKDFVRIAENLLNNAVKYGDRARPITIRAECVDGFVRWSVHNWGTPISPAEQGRMFEFLVRAQTARERATPGWGIGLTLVRGLVEAHSGTIKVRSSVNEGTVFEIEMPRVAGGPKPA